MLDRGRRSCPHRHRIRTGLFETKSPLRGNGIFRAETKEALRPASEICRMPEVQPSKAVRGQYGAGIVLGKRTNGPCLSHRCRIDNRGARAKVSHAFEPRLVEPRSPLPGKRNF